MRTSTVVIGVLLTVLALNTAGQNTPSTIEVSPKAITLATGQTATFKTTPPGAAPVNSPTIATIDSATGKIIAKTTAGEEDVEFQSADKAAKTTIHIRVVELGTVAIDGAQQPLYEGERRPITIRVSDPQGREIKDLNIRLLSNKPAVVNVDGTTTLVAQDLPADKTTDTAEITIQSNNETLKLNGQERKFTVTVREAVKEVRYPGPTTRQVDEGQTIDLKEWSVSILGRHNGTYSPGDRPLALTAGENVVELKDNRFLVVKELPTVYSGKLLQQRVVLTSPEASPSVPVTPMLVFLDISPRPFAVIVQPGLVNLPVGGVSPALKAVLVDRTGAPMPTATLNVTWSFAQNDSAKYVQIAKPTPDSVQLIWKNAENKADEDKRPELVEIHASAGAPGGSGSLITGTAIVRLLRETVTFAPLNVKLTVMDDQMASDLYGKKTAEEFYVARVRLNNNLRNSPNTDVEGASILAFSDSIEVAVALQERPIDGGRTKPPSKWTDVTDREIEDIADTGAVASPPPASGKTELQTKTCRGTITYRPYTFEMVANSLDPREGRSTRSRRFLALQAVGTAASFLTAVAVPGPGSDLPLALEKYSNLLIPGFQKLFPDLKETHRQNIVSQTMKQIEEVPYGSDVSRVLFFPKTVFTGLIRDHETRISEICPYFFQVEVAVLKKGGKTTVQGGTP